MLIVHRLSRDGYRYYLDGVRLGEPPGRWMGLLAPARGDVDGALLREMLPRADGRVPGFDLTFAAPKSVSVLHGLGSADIAGAARASHDRAVDAALAYLERHACQVRVRGVAAEGAGFTIAAFAHQLSRTDDPHLHTHALVANRTVAPDDRVLALHSALLYGERRAAGTVYQLVLRHELSRLLDVTWDSPRAGRADLAVVPQAVRDAFSQRGAAVRAATGGDPARARWAERVTRPERDAPFDIEQLRATWHARADRLGWEMPRLGPGRVATAPAPVDRLPEPDRWTRADLLVELATRWTTGADAARIDAECDRLLAAAIPLRTAPGQAAPRFTTRAAVTRRVAVDAALERTVNAHPLALDALRREQQGALVLVAPDARRAADLAARTGAVALTIDDAPTRLASLGPGNLVAFVGALDSGAIAATLRILPPEVAVARAVPGPAPEHSRSTGPAATIDTGRGELTAAGDAATARHVAIGDWVAARRAGRQAVLVVNAAELREVNAAARVALHEAGLLGRCEVGGFATGDEVRFTSGRPKASIRVHDRASVVAVGPAVDLRLDDGRIVSLDPRHLRGIAHAHAVPPLPMLVRGESFVIGGGPGAHRYVTVPVATRAKALASHRRTSLVDLDRASDHARLRRAALDLVRHERNGLGRALRDAPMRERAASHSLGLS